MKRLGTLITCLVTTLHLFAAADMGVDSVTGEWMREWYQWGDLKHYLDNYCDVTTYQVETTGGWATPEPLLFSINGNSYRWNKYYLDGFRVDSRIQAGNALYEADLFAHSMQIDYNRGTVSWQTDSLREAHVQLSGQAGNIGSYAYSAKWLQELQEGLSAIKRLKDDTPLRLRKHTVGAATADVVYNIRAHNSVFTQHIRADYGRRRQLRYGYDGITGTYDADYYNVQLDGKLPLPQNNAMDAIGYILRAEYREDGLSELGYNDNEVARQANVSLSLYARKDAGRQGQLTTGLTYAMQHNRHRDMTFSRNIIDVDGEGFEPWYPDGHTHELNWAVNYRYTILPWLKVHLDTYNSLLVFAPTQQTWRNSVYLQGYNMPAPLPLYDYHWHSEAFASGMLENSISIEADYAVLPWLRLRGSVAATLDGILLSQRSVVTPSWEAKADIHIEPAKWFKMDLIAANYRIPYTYETVQFLSDKYLSAEVNYAGTGTLLTTTGGRYHRISKGLQQPQYMAMDIPIVFTIGRHEISILSSIKKYYNTWSVRLADGQALSYTPVPADGSTYPVYAMQPGERYYEVAPSPKTGTGFWDTPVFASNVIKYSYNGRKVFFSMSWQSYCLSGASALGNGVQTEDIQVLSESTASPNAALNDANMKQTDTGIRSLGRLNQDRAYIARLQLGVNITENWQLSLSGKFRDGTPIAHYRLQAMADGSGCPQAVVWAANTRGINVVDGNFGERTDSFFNFDLRLTYRGAVRDVPFAVQAVCYNIWDFATELNEHAMYYDGATGKGVSDSRYPLSLCIPRGLLLTLSVGLEKNK
ncbi:MAG: hypothetical protein IJT12_04260 [Paludibacteraceae bacterium]|nr:hypothetical protein [Paludibacteraceae bacterium]